MQHHALAVEFIDERYELSEDELTFGRAAALVVDGENEFMSRVVGSFTPLSGWWWITNRSSASPLNMIGDDGVTVTLAPAAGTMISSPAGAVRFRAGRSNYELLYELAVPPTPPDALGEAQPETSATATMQFGVVPLNAEQKAMLALFAQAWLLKEGGNHHTLPQNQEVANTLGWSLKKLDRKLDYLCARLSDAGVSGLRGERGAEASDRRRRLIDHVLQMAMITAQDLPE